MNAHTPVALDEGDETPAEEFSRLIIEFNEGERQNRGEAWNLIADFACEHSDTIIRALSAVGGEAGDADCDAEETVDHNPKSWAAWKREAERLRAEVARLDNELNISQQFETIARERFVAAESELARLKAQPGVVKALEDAEKAFEEIRLILVKHLDEPERSAFWKAARARDAVRATLAAPVSQEPVATGWHPLTHKDGKMTCPLPADETVVEVMLQNGTICRAWYACNTMDAGDWDFMPVTDDDEPDMDADSIASSIVGWRSITEGEPSDAEVVEALEIGLAYANEAVQSDGGIDICEIGLRTDFEKIQQALLAAKSKGGEK